MLNYLLIQKILNTIWLDDTRKRPGIDSVLHKLISRMSGFTGRETMRYDQRTMNEINKSPR